MRNLLLLSLAICTACASYQPTTRLNFKAPDVYPEGIAFDPAKRCFYVSSVRTGTIGKVDSTGNYSVVYQDAGLKSSYGLKLHTDGKRLFACVGDATASKFGTPETKKKMIRLICLDLSSGQKLMDTDLSNLVPGKHFANDLAFDEKGNVYITDSFANVIYKVDASGTASVLSKSEKFKTQGVGLNGIVYHPGGFLLVNNGEVVSVVDMEPFLLGADGMILNNDTLLTIVVGSGTDKIYQIGSGDYWKTAQIHRTTAAKDRFTGPSTATLKDGEVWVMNAKLSETMDSTNVPSQYFAIQHAELEEVKKK
ncbi:MAG: gluconolaconase [Bacteroidota bacterium]